MAATKLSRSEVKAMTTVDLFVAYSLNLDAIADTMAADGLRVDLDILALNDETMAIELANRGSDDSE